ncbi:hypothetical protein [Nesterenkonia pannonica]|uniref:hypothetical protein n=1 Tax=Nesterenkonia pannonica TaxID=1548602 RepID=UPI002164BDEF|nr:hypothetical protein [Nesterenkonia pannonica]
MSLAPFCASDPGRLDVRAVRRAPSAATDGESGSRIQALDAARGLAIVGMIAVNVGPLDGTSFWDSLYRLPTDGHLSSSSSWAASASHSSPAGRGPVTSGSPGERSCIAAASCCSSACCSKSWTTVSGSS